MKRDVGRRWDWDRGELENLRRTFPGMKWETKLSAVAGRWITEAHGRCSGLFIVARWLPSPHRFEVAIKRQLDSGDMVCVRSGRPWDAIRGAKKRLLSLYGSIMLAVKPSGKGM